MSQPCFDRPHFERLSERLLHAGIAPRHVHRYVRELRDHFDDLVAEEKTSGTARELVGTRALSRLGNDEDLAQAMLARPELKSFTARYPWAVFGIGPVVMLAMAIAAALFLEMGLLIFLNYLHNDVLGLTPATAAAKIANAKIVTLIFTGYNALAVYGAPPVFSWLIYRAGSRQKMRPAWIVTGVVLVCVLGGFQNLVFYDTGCRGCGHLFISSGLLSPFVHITEDGFLAPFHFAEGLTRAAMNLAIASGVWWWLTARKKASTTTELHTARM
jgi:hypothetical protein